MDGENNGNPMNKWMIWGFSHIFGNTHLWHGANILGFFVKNRVEDDEFFAGWVQNR